MIFSLPPTIPPPVVAEREAIEVPGSTLGESRLWRFHDSQALGTRLNILVNTHAGALANQAALAVRREIDRLDRVFNWRRADSELSRLNETRRMTVSRDLFAVIELSELWRRATNGAFDGRMGALLKLWSHRDDPDTQQIDRALTELRASDVFIGREQHRVELSSGIVLSLDAIAKAYIVDAALNAARRAVPSIVGLAVDIGGDIRCWGKGSRDEDWCVGISDPVRPADNASLVDAVSLENAAIATSGRGPRDRVHGFHRSTTISPLTGRPVRDVISTSVVATHSADADAIATALMVMPIDDSIELVERMEGVAARITDANEQVHHSSAWRRIQLAAAEPKKSSAQKAQTKKATPNKTTATPERTPEGKSMLSEAQRWPADWEIGINYVAPEKKENERAADFRTPYMVIWITDEDNRPVSTPVMVGQDPRWQKDNFVWWMSQGERATALVDLRSQATALSGRYRIFWGGLDENWQPLPLGKYVLHLETSQERGKHSHRSIELDLGRERFKKTLPNLPESGGLEITYGHYNDRFKDE